MKKYKFSLVIPNSGKSDKLSFVLDSIFKASYSPNDFEVLVIENNLTNSKQSREIKKNFLSKKNLHFHKIRSCGASFARNYGARIAKHSHLLFIDDDILVGKNYFIGWCKTWDKYPNSQILGGEIRAKPFDHLKFSRFESSIIDTNKWCFAVQNVSENDKELSLGELVFSANLSIKKNIEDGNYFNESFGLIDKNISHTQQFGGEDYEICSRNIIEGKSVRWISVKEVTVDHLIDSSRFSFFYLLNRYKINGFELAKLELLLEKNYGRKYVGYFNDSLNVFESTTNIFKFVRLIAFFFAKKCFKF